MDHTTRILHLDDNQSDGDLVLFELKRRQYPCAVTFIQTRQEFIAAIEKQAFDLILCDYKMPEFDGDEAFAMARQCCPEIPFILVTGELGEEFVIERLKKGVSDYVLKDNIKRLVPTIERAIEERDERRRLKEAERKLRQNEERLRFHVENSPLAVVEWDKNYYVTGWSQEAERLFGWSAQETIGKRIDALNLIYAPDVPIVEKTMQRLSSGREQTVVSTNRNITKSGKVIECTWYNSVLVDAEGKMESSLSLILDITERERAAESLRQSEQRLRQIIDLVPHFIFAKDCEGRFILVNQSVADAYGTTIRELIGKTDADFAKSDEEVRHFREDDMAVITSGAPKFIPEEVITDASGHVRTLTTIKIPFTSSGMTSPAILGVSVDITERKKAEEALRSLNAELEQRVKGRTEEITAANKELESFTYSVSHDLKAPLRAISGYASILLEDSRDRMTAEDRRYLSLIANNAVHLNTLVGELLAFSQLSRQEVNTQSVDMNAIVREVIQAHRESEPARSFTIEVGNLDTAQADPVLIRQVVENLVSNAIKYARNQPRPIVEIGSKTENRETVYWVKDNGAGFDMQYYDKLFGVFQRLHRSDEYEGTGVGLAFSQRIVQRHGGRIWAEAEVGKGATFYFSLPHFSPPTLK